MSAAMALLRRARVAGIAFVLENADQRVRYFGDDATRAAFKPDIDAHVVELIEILKAEARGRACGGCGTSTVMLVTDAGFFCNDCLRPRAGQRYRAAR